MKGRLYFLRADGTQDIREIEQAPDLQTLKGGIGGGYLAPVPYFTKFGSQRCVAFCDEDGIRKGLPANLLANVAWAMVAPGAAMQDCLLGDVVVVAGDDELIGAM